MVGELASTVYSMYRKKIASLLIVGLFVFSIFGALLMTSEETEAAPLGTDWIIASGTSVTIDEDYPGVLGGVFEPTGNIIVMGGNLTIMDVTLRFKMDDGWDPSDPSDDNHFSLIVNKSGRLTFENATLTVSTEAIFPHLTLPVLVDNATLRAKNSVFEYPGWLTAENNANIYIDDSTIKKLDSTIPNYAQDKEGYLDLLEYSPLLEFSGSTVVLANSIVQDYRRLTGPEYICNATGGSTSGTGGISNVNSSSDGRANVTLAPGESIWLKGFENFDFKYLNTVTLVVEYRLPVNYTITTKSSTNVSINNTNEPTTARNTSISIPTTKVPVTWTVKQDSNLRIYGVDTGSNIEDLEVYLENEDDSGNTSHVIEIDKIYLKVKPWLPTKMEISGDTELYVIDTFLDLTFQANQGWVILNMSGNSTLYGFNMTTNPPPSPPTDKIYAIAPDLEGGTNTTAYLYRWLELDAVDNVNQTVGNAGANITYFIKTQVDIVNATKTNNTFNNSSIIIQYLNRTRSNTDYPISNTTYLTLDKLGTPLRIPLLTDIINGETGPNGLPVGKYLINMMYNNGTKNFTGIDNIFFASYPTLTTEENTQSKTVTIGNLTLPSPDLTINSSSDITWSPVYPVQFDNVTLFANITNIGEADATAGVEVWFYSYPDETVIGHTTTTQTISKSGYQLVNVTWANIDEGDHQVLVRIDPDGEVNWNDDVSNNEMVSEAFYVNRSMDLEPTSIQISDTTQNVNNEITFTIKVKNNGKTAVTGPFVVAVINGTAAATGTVLSNTTWTAGVAAGAEVTMDIPWTPTETGTYRIWASVDTGDAIVEYNESNNDLNYSAGPTDITVTPRPNLRVDTFYSTSSFVDPGENFTIRATVENNGTTATGEFWVRIYDDMGEKVNESKFTGLAASGVGWFNATFNLVITGLREIYVAVDWNDTVSNESLEVGDPNYDNDASLQLLVISSTRDILINDTLPDASGSLLIENEDNRLHYGNIIVAEGGILTIRNSNFEMNMTNDYENTIIVKENGTLVLENSKISSSHSMSIKLYDNATLKILAESLVMDKVGIGSVGASVYGGFTNIGATIEIDESWVYSDITSASGVDTNIVAINSTITPILEISGDSVIELFDVVTSSGQPVSITPTGNAAATRYWWLLVEAVDANGIELAGANVTVYKNTIPPPTKYANLSTDGSGQALFSVPVETITASGSQLYPMYRINGTYNVDEVSDTKAKTVLKNEEAKITFGTVKPDLNVTSFYLTPSIDIVAGQTVNVAATVNNTGLSVARGASIYIYDQNTGKVIYNQEHDIDTGSFVNIAATWKPETSTTYTLWIKVDRNDLIDEDTNANNNQSISVLVNASRPDISVNSLTTLDSDDNPISNAVTGETIKLSAVISNVGPKTLTQSFTVIFYVSVDGGAQTQIGSAKYPTFPVGGLVTGASIWVNTTWTITGSGSMTFNVTADLPSVVPEIEETSNNFITHGFYVFGKPNLVIASEDIEFSNTAPITGDPVTISATIYNNGGANVTSDFSVEFYDGNPSSDGTKIGEVPVTSDVNVGANIVVTWPNWQPPKGVRNVYVRVDPPNYNNVTETEETTDNVAYRQLLVYRLGDDWVIDDNDVWTLNSGQRVSHDGYILIKDNGVLRVEDGTTLVVEHTSNYQYNIIIMDNGSLILEGSALESVMKGGYIPMGMRVYLYDDANLYVNDSSIGASIDLYVYERSTVYVEEGSISGNLDIIGADADASLTAINSTFSKRLDSITGTSVVELTSVAFGDLYIKASDSSVVNIYRWLEVTVLDGAGWPLPNANVRMAIYPYDPIFAGFTQTRVTDANGKALFRVKTDQIDAVDQNSYGSYQVDAWYIFASTNYSAQSPTYPTFESYPSSKNLYYTTLVIPGAKPDLDPLIETGSSSLIRGERTWIRVYSISNLGSATAHEVMIGFEDDNSNGIWGESGDYTVESSISGATTMSVQSSWDEGMYLIGDIDPGEEMAITVNWTAKYNIGDHVITARLDPEGDINETNTANNNVSTMITVTGLSDLKPTSIKFYNYDNGIGSQIASPTTDGPVEGSSVVIVANITNIGDVEAAPTGNFGVSFYDGTTLIETNGTVNSIVVGQYREISIVWSDIMTGLHDIRVIVDEDDDEPEYDETNNEATRQITVKSKPNLIVSDIQFLPNKATYNDGETVRLDVYVRNQAVVGQQTATAEAPISVRIFIDADGDGRYVATSDDVLISAGSIMSNIASNQERVYSYTTWVAFSEGLLQSHNITARVNYDELVEETTTADNYFTKNMNVALTRNLVASNIRFSKLDPADGEDITIYVDVINDGNVDIASVNVWFYDGDPILGGLQIDGTQATGLITAGNPKTASVTWTATSNGLLIENHTICVWVDRYDLIRETTNADNTITRQITVRDKRADLTMEDVALDISFPSEVKDSQRTTAIVNVYNHGLTVAENFSVALYDAAVGPGHLIGSGLLTVNASGNNTVEIPNLLIRNPGVHTIFAVLDPTTLDLEFGQIDETNEDNNEFNTTVGVQSGDYTLVITAPPDNTEYEIGDTITIIGTIETQAVIDGSVEIQLYVGGEEYGLPQVVPHVTSDSFIVEMRAPSEEGGYSIHATGYFGGTEVEANPADIQIIESGGEPPLPLWLIITIVAIIAAAIIGPTVYLYKFGLGKLVECGECAALIPIGSKKCPRCGVEFELDTAKCSICGTWVPMSSEKCPECGAEFTAVEMGEKEYRDKMKERYNTFLDQYRRQARARIGKDMTEEQFQTWWTKHPDYIAFDAWLALEEAKRDMDKPLQCPRCGHLNSPGSETCDKCGTNLGGGGGSQGPGGQAPPAKPATAVPKRVETPAPAPEAPQAAPTPVPTAIPKRVETPAPAPAAQPVVAKKVVAQPETVVAKKVVAKPETVVAKKVVAKPETVVAKKVVAKKKVE